MSVPALSWRHKVIAAACLALASSVAHATVSLVLTDNDSTPQSGVIIPGGTLNLTLNLISTQESSSGLNYYLNATGPTVNVVRYTDRVVNTSSKYQDLINTDATVETVTNSTLDPQSNLDLGASVNDLNTGIAGVGTHLVATFVTTIPRTATPGVYTLTTSSPQGLGYSGSAAESFMDHEFNNHASYNIVVPYAGDVNLDRVVNDLDYNILRTNFGLTGRTWITGDFNNDGTTNFIDYQMLEVNFGRSISLPAAAAPIDGLVVAPADVVPEPSISLACLVGLLLVRRRRNHQ